MSLGLLVIMVVAGVSAIVLAVHLTGGSRPARLADADAARRRFADDFPDLRVRSVYPTADGSAAFLALDDGCIGLVQAVGDKFLTRVLSPGDPSGNVQVRDVTLTLRFADFTFPGATFSFRDAEEAATVARLLADGRVEVEEDA